MTTSSTSLTRKMGIETEAGLEGLEVRQCKGGVHVFPAVIPGAGLGVRQLSFRFSSGALIESCFSTEVLQTCLYVFTEKLFSALTYSYYL